MECEFPTVNSDDETIVKIFEDTKVIAIVGCSPNEQKDSHKVAKYLLEKGFIVIPMYPKEEEILGQKVYRDLSEIEKDVDMVVVFRKPSAVLDIVQSCIKKGGVKYLWTQIGIVNNEAAKQAQENGMTVVQNRCAMVEHKKLFERVERATEV